MIPLKQTISISFYQPSYRPSRPPFFGKKPLEKKAKADQSINQPSKQLTNQSTKHPTLGEKRHLFLALQEFAWKESFICHSERRISGLANKRFFVKRKRQIGSSPRIPEEPYFFCFLFSLASGRFFLIQQAATHLKWDKADNLSSVIPRETRNLVSQTRDSSFLSE